MEMVEEICKHCKHCLSCMCGGEYKDCKLKKSPSERALDFGEMLKSHGESEDSCASAAAGYEKGAKEQRAIDIEKAIELVHHATCEWNKLLKDYNVILSPLDDYLRKGMDEYVEKEEKKMKTIKERAKEYADNFVVGDSAVIVDLLHKVAEESYIQGATEQRQIDDAELAEVKRQRDEYYDELLELRRRKAIDDAELEKIVSSWKEEEEYWIKRNKKLIEKACAWLKRLPPQWEVYEDAHYEIDRDSIIEELRKYMEE